MTASARRVMVTGGAGFIGSAVVRRLLAMTSHEVLAFDAFTYAAVPGSLPQEGSRLRIVRGDVADATAVGAALDTFQPNIVLHLAAESHVDRSIDGPARFVRTNVMGTFVLLDQVLRFWRGLSPDLGARFRLHHISTDEVFGSLGVTGRFTETTSYDPRSPYSASKAGSDHLVRAWGHTYGLPILITNCSNNYGPRQYPEKLIPLLILRALAGQSLPIYGDGRHVRDWLFVEDHAEALIQVFETAEPGSTYVIGGDAERTTLEVAQAVCTALDHRRPRSDGRPHADAITLIEDRPGHDRRYAIDAARIAGDLDWRPTTPFDKGILQTVDWYLNNPDWIDAARRSSTHEPTARRGLMRS